MEYSVVGANFLGGGQWIFPGVNEVDAIVQDWHNACFLLLRWLFSLTWIFMG